MLDPHGTSTGEWLYRFFWHESIYQAGRQIRHFYDEVVTVVRDPANNDSVHYFTTGINEQGIEEASLAGLPYTRLRGDGARQLSRESFAGPAFMNADGSGRCLGSFCSAVGSRLRAEYATYERDEPCSGWPGTTCNRRRKDERTYFTDDPPSCGIPSGCTYRSVERSFWDGLGTYRKEVANGGGSFAPGHAREVWKNSNPTGAPLPSEPWVLSTYDYRYSLENGVKNEVRACFERSTGTLKRLRTLAGTSGTTSAWDTIAVYQRDTSGNTSRESIYGGDAQPVNADPWVNLCTVGLPSSPGYRVDHTWQFGVRKRSAEVDPASGVE